MRSPYASDGSATRCRGHVTPMGCGPAGPRVSGPGSRLGTPVRRGRQNLPSTLTERPMKVHEPRRSALRRPVHRSCGTLPSERNRERRDMNVATRVSEQDGCVVVSVDGELDLGTAEQLQETLTTAIAEAAGPIVLDLTNLRFCDSAGLAVLVKAHNTLSDQGRRLVLARPTTAVSR